MNSLKKNLLYNTAYQVLVILIPLVTAPYLSRVLGTAGVGTYSYTQSIAYYFVLLGMLGLSNYGNRSIASVRDNKVERSKAFCSIYAMQVITCGAVLIAYFVYLNLNCVSYREIAIAQAVYVASAILDINWFFFGMELFKLTVARNFVLKLMTLVCVFVFVRSSRDLWKYTLIMAVGTMVSQSWIWFYLPRYIKRVRVTWKDIAVHFKPNLILFVPVIAYSIYNILDKIMVGNMSNISEVGIYDYAERVVGIPLGFITAVGTVMLPRMSYMVVNSTREKVESYIYSSMKYMTLASSAMAFGLMAIGSVFGTLYLGEAFSKSGVQIEMLAITLLFISWANVIRTQYLIPYGYDRVYLASTITGAFVNLLVNLFMIPRYAGYGAVIGTIFAEGSVVVVQLIAIRKQLNIKRFVRESYSFVIFGLIMFFIVKTLALHLRPDLISLIIEIVTGALIYLILTFIYLFLTKDQFVIHLCEKMHIKKNQTP